MGKTNSKPRENRLGLDYEILATEGNTIHLVNNSNQQVLQLKTISAEAAALPWVVPLVSRAVVLQHDHLSPVVEFQVNQDGSLSVLAATPYRTLQDQRDERIAQSVPFEAIELWTILASLIFGFAYLQRNNVPFGAVKASNINVEESGQLRIANPLTVLDQGNLVLQANGQTREVLYLSPRELEALKHRPLRPNHDPYKSDVFALGVVLIDLALLANQKDIFTPRMTLDAVRLEQALDQLQAKYGVEFRSIVQIMTEPAQPKRLDWIQLEEFVRKTDSNPSKQPLPAEIIQIESRQQTPVSSQHGVQPIKHTATFPAPPIHYHSPPQQQQHIKFTHQRKPTSQSTGRNPPERRPEQFNSQIVSPAAALQGVSHPVRSATYLQHQRSGPLKTEPSFPHGRPIERTGQFLNHDMIHYQPKSSQPVMQHMVGMQHHPQVRLNNTGMQHTPPRVIAAQLTENQMMCNSHHFGMASQHLSQTRQLTTHQSQMPEHLTQRPLQHVQPQITSQVKPSEQRSPQGLNIATNRIIATNMNREKSQGKSPTRVSQTASVQPPQQVISPFQKKVVSQKEQRPVTLPQYSEMRSAVQQAAPVNISFNFQSHNPPSMVTASETKQFVQKEIKSADKLTPVSALLPNSPQERREPVLPAVASGILQPSIHQQTEQQQLYSSDAPSVIPAPQWQPPKQVTSMVVTTPPQSALQFTSAFANLPAPSNFGTSTGINGSFGLPHPISGIAHEQLPQPFPPSVQSTLPPPLETQDYHYSSGQIDNDDKPLNIKGLFEQEEDKPAPNEKGIVGESQMSIIERERKALMGEGDRFGHTQQLRFDESYGYSHSNIKPQENSFNKWSELKLEEKPSNTSKPSRPFGYQPSDFSRKADDKVSVEVQTTPNVSEIRRNNPSSARNVQYSEKQVSTSTLHNSPAKHEHSSFRRVPPKYEGETMKGFRHGFGKYTFQDGSYYEGMWNFNRMQGQGKLYYASGKLAYEGGWSQDQIHGTGKLYNQHPKTTGSIDYKDLGKASHSWRTFEGNFEYDMRSGKGTLTFENGESFTGKFEGDRIEGEGIFHGHSRTIHGYWSQDQLKSVL